MKKAYSVCGIAALAMGVLVVSASIARAQVLIKVNDDVNFKLGVLGQFQVDTIKDNGTDVTASNLFVRRLRLLFGGQVAKSVTFFVETDTPNLGKTLATGKNITPATIIQDAYGEFKPSNGFSVDAGLMFVEQPLAHDDLSGLARLTRLSPTPIGADEGIHSKLRSR